MFLNEAKGSFGMFSRAGRNSTEKYHILSKKDEILSGKQKKYKPTDLFGDPNKDNSEDEDDIELIKIDKQKKSKNLSTTIEPKNKVKENK